MDINIPQPNNLTNPSPPTDISSGAPPAATTSSIPALFTQSKQYNEGPQPAPGATPTPDKPAPKGDNSAPPAITNPTPLTPADAPSLASVVGSILFFILAGFGIYYGWVLGMQKGREYLLFVQSFGSWLRSFFVRPVPVTTRI